VGFLLIQQQYGTS